MEWKGPMIGLKRALILSALFLFSSCKTKERSDLDYRSENPTSMTAADLQQATKQTCLLRGRVWDDKTQSCVTPQVACQDVPDSRFDFTKNICLSPRDLCFAEGDGNAWVDGQCLSNQQACEKEQDGSVWVKGQCVKSKEACDALGYHWKWIKDPGQCLVKGFLEHCTDNKAPDSTKKTIAFLRSLQKNMPVMSCQETYAYLRQIKFLDIPPAKDASAVLDDIYPLSDIAELESLNIEGHPVEDILPAGKISSLQKLIIKDGHKLSDLTVLSGSKKLTYLDVSGNKIKSLKGLNQLTSLQALIISRNEVEELLAIRDLVNLATIALDENPLKSLSFLRELKKITSISATGTPIGSVLPKTPVNCPRGPDIAVALDRFCGQLQY